VGYEHSNELMEMFALGFIAIGALTMWLGHD